MSIGREDGNETASHRARRAPRPLDPARLDELALTYVAHFATSTGRLADYLKRKLRERGWAGEGPAAEAVAAVVARMAEARYIDDAGFALARAQGLSRRGYGARRIAGALDSSGISAADTRAAMPGARVAREAALELARRRRFGPFATDDPASLDLRARRARREKQIAAMLRAGHPLDTARELVDSPSIEASEQWVAAAPDDET